MKTRILLFSLIVAILATFNATFTTLNSDTPAVFSRWMAVSGYLGLLSVTSFFVGLAFPKNS